MTAVVVLGASEGDAPPGLDLAAGFVDLRFAPDAPAATAAIPDAEVAFAWDERLLEPAWDAARVLRWVQSPRTGVDGILFPAFAASDVVLTNARGVYDAATAEWAIGAILAMAKDIPANERNRATRTWAPREVELVAGRHLLVVGIGPIGRAVARAARALGMEVRGVGRRARPGDPVFGYVLGVDELPDGLAWADVVVDALPATRATAGIFDAAAFAAMRAGSRFVNVGRGSTVVEDALVDAVRSGHLAGAALDVFEREPLPSASALWDLDRVLISPHAGAMVGGWREAVVEVFLENLDRFLRGAPLRNVVDKAAGFVVG
ncbi:MAG: D-2-hydroxyacid dehydrogenase [Actinomycetota bacterium]